MNILPRSIRILGCLATAALASSHALAQDPVTGDPAAGKQKAAMCIGCHSIPGYQSSFPEIHKVPMISGQNARYLSAALSAYRKGDRKHPTMRGISASLTDQDIADLSAYYESHGQGAAPASSRTVPVPSQQIQALLTRGKCVACHGENLNKPIDSAYPKLAGQHADYLLVAMRAYQIDNNPYIGRANAIMAAQMKDFTRAELKLLANYMAGLPGDLRTVPQARFR